MIDLYSYATSVDDKIKMMDMIDELDVNHKVGKIYIELRNDNKFS